MAQRHSLSGAEWCLLCNMSTHEPKRQVCSHVVLRPRRCGYLPADQGACPMLLFCIAFCCTLAGLLTVYHGNHCLITNQASHMFTTGKLWDRDWGRSMQTRMCEHSCWKHSRCCSQHVIEQRANDASSFRSQMLAQLKCWLIHLGSSVGLSASGYANQFATSANGPCNCLDNTIPCIVPATPKRGVLESDIYRTATEAHRPCVDWPGFTVD